MRRFVSTRVCLHLASCSILVGHICASLTNLAAWDFAFHFVCQLAHHNLLRPAEGRVGKKAAKETLRHQNARNKKAKSTSWELMINSTSQGRPFWFVHGFASESPTPACIMYHVLTCATQGRRVKKGFSSRNSILVRRVHIFEHSRDSNVVTWCVRQVST